MYSSSVSSKQPVAMEEFDFDSKLLPVLEHVECPRSMYIHFKGYSLTQLINLSLPNLKEELHSILSHSRDDSVTDVVNKIIIKLSQLVAGETSQKPVLTDTDRKEVVSVKIELTTDSVKLNTDKGLSQSKVESSIGSQAQEMADPDEEDDDIRFIKVSSLPSKMATVELVLLDESDEDDSSNGDDKNIKSQPAQDELPKTVQLPSPPPLTPSDFKTHVAKKPKTDDGITLRLPPVPHKVDMITESTKIRYRSSTDGKHGLDTYTVTADAFGQELSSRDTAVQLRETEPEHMELELSITDLRMQLNNLLEENKRIPEAFRNMQTYFPKTATAEQSGKNTLTDAWPNIGELYRRLEQQVLQIQIQNRVKATAKEEGNQKKVHLHNPVYDETVNPAVKAKTGKAMEVEPLPVPVPDQLMEDDGEESNQIDHSEVNARPAKRRCTENTVKLIKACIETEKIRKRFEIAKFAKDKPKTKKSDDTDGDTDDDSDYSPSSRSSSSPCRSATASRRSSVGNGIACQQQDNGERNSYRVPHQTDYTDSKKIEVCGLPHEMTPKDVESAFSRYGKVEAVRISKKGIAFVEYANDGSAQKAITKLNCKEFRGRQIRVQMTRRRTKKCI